MAELRLICEDCRNIPAKLFSQKSGIFLMRHFNKPADCSRIQCVQISLVIEPWIVSRNFQISKPLIPAGPCVLFFLQYRIFSEATVFQPNLIPCKPNAFIAPNDLSAGFLFAFHNFSVLTLRRKKKETDPISMLPGNQAASCTRRPPILIIKPGQHLFFIKFFICIFYQPEKFFAHIGVIHSGSTVDMSAAHSHILQRIDGIINILFIHPAVPGPKRRSPVFTTGITKYFSCQFVCFFI